MSGRTSPAGLLVVLSLCAAVATAGAASPPAALGGGGAVASDEAQATVVGLALLARGGNAIDAAVATALALAVVHPSAGNLAGGGFAVARCGGELVALDFRETAPAAAHPDLFLDAAGARRAGLSTDTPFATGVPGTPAGLFELHRRLGRLPWREVVAPAERLARGGFAMSGRLAAAFASEAKRLARSPQSAAAWLVDGRPRYAAGDRVQLPALADALAGYAERGPAALTSGTYAAVLVATSTRHGGVLALEDLAAYRPLWREPLRFTALGREFAAMPLPSSGGFVVAQSLAMLERLHWAEKARFGADRAHLLAEALRRAFADRFLLGDPASTLATLEQLLDPAWIARRAASVARDHATESRAVRPFPKQAAGEPNDTTHLSVLDRDGCEVALTTTLNDAFGCALWVPEAGVFLNNELDDFTTVPDTPNLFGLIQGEGNRIVAGRRPLSSMTPMLVRGAGETLALGGRGGSRIPSATLQVLLHLAVDGDGLQAAIDRPRLHQQWLPDRLEHEADALSPETAAELARRGHTLFLAKDLPKVNAARRRADGRFEAAADSRGPGGAGVVAPLP